MIKKRKKRKKHGTVPLTVELVYLVQPSPGLKVSILSQGRLAEICYVLPRERDLPDCGREW
jgi:hypothetical protein